MEACDKNFALLAVLASELYAVIAVGQQIFMVLYVETLPIYFIIVEIIDMGQILSLTILTFFSY